MSGEHEGRASSCIPFLLVVLLTLAGLPLVHVASPSFDDAERNPANTYASPLHHIDAHGFSANSNESRRYSLGALHEKIPDKSRASLALARGLPTHFDWRDYAGQNWMTSIKDQGGCGSCVAFGAVAAVEGQFKIQMNNPTSPIDLSETHLFSCGGGLCNYGWWVSSALNYLQANGTPDEACSPYRDWDVPCTSSCSDWQSRAYKISSWSWITSDPTSIQAALQDGPLVATFDVYYDFFSYGTGVYHWDHSSPWAGGHAVAIVGYDSIEQYWIAKNSWGADWGDNGYFKIGFGEVGIEQEVASVTASVVTATATVTLTEASASYPLGTTTRTSTSYTSTSTLTSTVPTVTTFALLLIPVTTIVQSVQYLTSILTATTTSYVATQISTSTTVVPVTVTVTPSTTTSTVETTQVLVETGTTIVTSYRTSTTTSYTGTQTATSIVTSLTTVALVPSTATSTAQSTELVTSVTSATATSYMTTTTSTSTSVVHTTVTSLGSVGASNPLIYLGFASMLTLGAGRVVIASRSRKNLQVRLQCRRARESQ